MYNIHSGSPAILVFLMGSAPVQVLPNISQLILVFVWFYVENLATNIKTAQLSELCEFYRKYQNVANFASISLRKIKNAAVNERQHFKLRKFSNATNFKVRRMCRFVPTFILVC